jgi:hypothetical protein
MSIQRCLALMASFLYICCLTMGTASATESGVSVRAISYQFTMKYKGEEIPGNTVLAVGIPATLTYSDDKGARLQITFLAANGLPPGAAVDSAKAGTRTNIVTLSKQVFARQNGQMIEVADGLVTQRLGSTARMTLNDGNGDVVEISGTANAFLATEAEIERAKSGCTVADGKVGFGLDHAKSAGNNCCYGQCNNGSKDTMRCCGAISCCICGHCCQTP